ncbi:MAG: hypothetical protein IT558_03295 [Alphaproteobacteria bacterium]|nr:hypothetical protein [Alphaproteobacteria bacterium]
MPSRSLRYVLFCVPLALAACGEGWEPHRIDNMVPYGNTRTAGTGVAYVRAKMMQEKEMKLPATEEAKPVKPVTEPDAVKSAEPVFEEKQKK